MDKKDNLKNKKAVALKYDSNKDVAPKVVASGKGLLAEKIMEIACQENIPIYKDPKLVEALLQIDINVEIPPELYKAVAEILAFIYAADVASNTYEDFY